MTRVEVEAILKTAPSVEHARAEFDALIAANMIEDTGDPL